MLHGGIASPCAERPACAADLGDRVVLPAVEVWLSRRVIGPVLYRKVFGFSTVVWNRNP